MIISKTAKNNKLNKINKTQIFTNFGFVNMPSMFICRSRWSICVTVAMTEVKMIDLLYI